RSADSHLTSPKFNHVWDHLLSCVRTPYVATRGCARDLSAVRSGLLWAALGWSGLLRAAQGCSELLGDVPGDGRVERRPDARGRQPRQVLAVDALGEPRRRQAEPPGAVEGALVELGWDVGPDALHLA